MKIDNLKKYSYNIKIDQMKNFHLQCLAKRWKMTPVKALEKIIREYIEFHC